MHGGSHVWKVDGLWSGGVHVGAVDDGRREIRRGVGRACVFGLSLSRTEGFTAGDRRVALSGGVIFLDERMRHARGKQKIPLQHRSVKRLVLRHDAEEWSGRIQ